MRSHLRIAVELSALAAATAVVAVMTFVTARGGTHAPFSPPVLGGQPGGAVVVAQEDKDLAVALALKPEVDGLGAVVTVLGQDGTGATGLHARVDVKTANGNIVSADARPGAEGTYQSSFATKSKPVSATVTIEGAGSSNRPLDFALPASWPPKPSTTLMRRVTRVYSNLRSLVTHEHLASDPTHAIDTTYRAIAPSTLQITSSNGIEAVVIGAHRWDRNPGGDWRESPQSPPIAAISPYWAGGIQDSTILGSVTISGHPAWVVSFAAPQMPAFFTIDVDKRTNRVLELRMTASAHFMRHVYGPFDTKIRIGTPR